ncbi:hypothetical protein [Mesorhizobium sp.]|uniref:hypothetical protein n=1 Tax=Mesorhizobium sp. TaxID=1871066 RepID=UPI0025D09A93|nr:hypothetical protein [Mesorhizobium sp.]
MPSSLHDKMEVLSRFEVDLPMTDAVEDTEEPISAILLNQRYRNHLIGYFSWVSSFQEQREYQATVPLVHVPHEAFNQWEDYASDRILDHYVEPVFSKDEQEALRAFRDVWNSASDDTPQRLPSLEELIGTESWERLRIAAEKALEVFMRRGPFDWDREEFPMH